MKPTPDAHDERTSNDKARPEPPRGAGFGLTATIIGLFSRWTAGAQTRVPDEVQARFLRWSRTATGFVDLTAGDARTYLEWMLRSGVTLDSVSDLDPDAYRGTPLEKRLLEGLVHRRVQDRRIVRHAKL